MSIDSAVQNARESKLQRSKAIMDRLEFDYARLCSKCTWNQKGICREPMVSDLRIVNGEVLRFNCRIEYAREEESLCGKDGDLWAPKTPWQKHRTTVFWTIGFAVYLSVFATCWLLVSPLLAFAFVALTFYVAVMTA